MGTIDGRLEREDGRVEASRACGRAEGVLAFHAISRHTWSPAGTPYDEVLLGVCGGADHRERQRRGSLRAERRGGPPPTGRRQPPTSSPASTSTANWEGREGSEAFPSWSIASSTPLPIGASRGATSRATRMRRNFRNELAHLMLRQKACFQFAGVVQRGRPRGAGATAGPTTRGRGQVGRLRKGEARPQCLRLLHQTPSNDSLESILDLAKTEGMLFKWGSGTGTNLSSLREEEAILSGGGRASGPLSFHEGSGRLRRCHQVRRQDAPGGQDGDSECRPSGYRRVHQVEGERGEEGSCADRRGLRPRAWMAKAYSSIFFPECETIPCALPTSFMHAVVEKPRVVDQSRCSRASPTSDTRPRI